MENRLDEGIPAWIVCVDMLNKARRELVTQAIETLDKEVEAKRMDIKGSMITVPDQPSEDEMKLYVIGQILTNAEQMRERYGGYIKEVHTKGANATAVEMESADRARLLLMAVEKIEILVGYSRLLDSWIADVSMQIDTSDPILILRKTSEVHGRKEVLNFLKNNKTMIAEETFSVKERKIIEGALAEVT
jgi:hypothetical protein